MTSADETAADSAGPNLAAIGQPKASGERQITAKSTLAGVCTFFPPGIQPNKSEIPIRASIIISNVNMNMDD